MANEKQKHPWWKRILLTLIIIAMVLLGVSMLVRYVVTWQLGSEITKIAKANEPLNFSDLEQPATTENAADYYARALAKINLNISQNISRANLLYRNTMISSENGQVPNVLDTQITPIMAPLSSTLKEFDNGAELGLSGFDIGIREGMEKCRNNLERLRIAGLAMSLRTLQSIANDKDDDAVNSIISTLKLIRILDSYPVIVVSPIKTMSLKMIYQDVYSLLKYGQPSPGSLEKLQDALSQTISGDSLERIFFTERVYQIEIARNLIPTDIVSQYLKDKIVDLPEQIPAPASRFALMRYRLRSARFFRDFAGIIASARQPWPGPLDTIVNNAASAETNSLALSASVIVQLTTESLIDTRCAMLAIAIERYHRLNNELPGSLDDLLPAYIDSIPQDPFTGGKLMYNLDGEIYTVYSAGSNRLDDSGSVVPQNNQKKSLDKGIQINFYESK